MTESEVHQIVDDAVKLEIEFLTEALPVRQSMVVQPQTKMTRPDWHGLVARNDTATLTSYSAGDILVQYDEKTMRLTIYFAKEWPQIIMSCIKTDDYYLGFDQDDRVVVIHFFDAPDYINYTFFTDKSICPIVAKKEDDCLTITFFGADMTKATKIELPDEVFCDAIRLHYDEKSRKLSGITIQHPYKHLARTISQEEAHIVYLDALRAVIE